MTRLLKLVIGWVLLAGVAAVQAQSPAGPDNHHTHSCQAIPTFGGVNSLCRTGTYTNYRLWANIITNDPERRASASHPARLFWRDSFGHSETATPTAPARQIRIVHINGIATTRRDADNNLNAIMARVIETSTYLCNPVRSWLAYNRSRPDPLLGTPVNDLMEVAVQKHRENPNTRFSDMVRLVYLADTGATWLARSNIPLAVVHAVLGALDEWYQRANTWVDSDLRDIVADIRPHLARGERVLLVPHSQGNLFANMVMGSLRDAAGNPMALRQLGIASPAASVQRGRYLSSVNDTVLRKLALLADVLPLNLDIPSGGLAHTLDPRGHNLIDIYLHPELPGLAHIRGMASMMLEEMVGTEPNILAQCPHKAVSQMVHYEARNIGERCDPLWLEADHAQGIAVHEFLFGTSSYASSFHSLSRHIPPSNAPEEALAQLDSWTRLALGPDGRWRVVEGRWRVVKTDNSSLTLEYTSNGRLCHLNQAFARYWAFVFDPR